MFKLTIMAAALAAAAAAQASVSPDEAKQLGTTLTAVGAEKAANKDGTIPEYTGGLTAAPAGFVKGSGVRPDPYAADKPRLVITGKNLAGQEDKLTAGTRELLKRFPTFRVDVYPTHRPVTLPKALLDNTAKNATSAKAVDGGVGVENALAGVPFPIPKSGYEVMWNHLLRYQGHALTTKYESWNVDASGVPSLATAGEIYEEFPLSDPKNTEVAKQTDVFFRTKLTYLAPARRAGEGLMAFDAVNPVAQPRKVWQYLPGQRRVKLAPDVAYDTPNPGSAGASTYDDAWVFNGALDRFDFKLIGKKEMIVPYGEYKLFAAKVAADVTKPNHLNPDFVRWELHRVWVVEASLKQGKRHIYGKRTFYIDEDSWVALASDQYDARGQLYRSSFDHLIYAYDAQATYTGNHVIYDFVSGAYNLTGMSGPYGGLKYIDALKPTQWSPEALAGAGVR
ncbi:DUF1329 domain-containing protein [Rugamonas apoptosis]|uniref:DUF1329 domain-containing protein n=1 Tax=Rugamonas apoptosis TaxID=2758570 RepID=A0A7W2IM28_9BURK|nr:DUF1329 domain-containing protein [Rugamonas apoptosis]MBA5689253.1 DUF1329 domain-containing protein [Rugamonas apoptosis]